MIERSQAEIEADDTMELIADLPTEGDWKERSLLNHLYAMHKLRDENLYWDIHHTTCMPSEFYLMHTF